jgi:hypothetical protein
MREHRSALIDQASIGYPPSSAHSKLNILRGRNGQTSYQVQPLPIERQLASPTRNVTSGIIEKFSGLLRQRLRDPNPALRQDYVRLLLDEVIIADDLITMRGSKKALEPAISGNNGALGEVPTFIRDWRASQSTANQSPHHIPS